MAEKSYIHLREKLFLERNPNWKTDKTEGTSENIMQAIEERLEKIYGETRRKLEDLSKLNAYSYTIGHLGNAVIYDLPVDSGDKGKSIDIIADDTRRVLEIFSILTETCDSHDAKTH